MKHSEISKNMHKHPGISRNMYETSRNKKEHAGNIQELAGICIKYA